MAFIAKGGLHQQYIMLRVVYINSISIQLEWVAVYTLFKNNRVKYSHNTFSLIIAALWARYTLELSVSTSSALKSENLKECFNTAIDMALSGGGGGSTKSGCFPFSCFPGAAATGGSEDQAPPPAKPKKDDPYQHTDSVGGLLVILFGERRNLVPA